VKAKQLSEVKDILNSERFRTWFDGQVKARVRARDALLRHDELQTQVHLMEFRAEQKQKNASDTLYRSGEYEDAASSAEAEATDLENKSMDLVGEYEGQRSMCSDLWAAMTALEQAVEAKKEKALESKLKKTREEYERQTAKKNRLWEDVEAMWGASLEKSLSYMELQVKARRVRGESELLFADADKSTRSAAAIRAESEQTSKEREAAEAALKEMLGTARTSFDAFMHEEFMYWPQRENNKQVWVVPLFSDQASYNLELKACTVYQASRQRGVQFLEPVVETRKDREDTRLADFFTKDRPSVRKGAARAG
jgi:hypothetical protein